jgi:hypothetical protein
MLTVVELPEFQRRARAVMSDQERMAVISHLAQNPLAGVALGGGLRKVRFARESGGKSGGYRTVHFLVPDTGPVFVLTVFAKNEKASLTRAETGALIRLADQITAHYRSRP